MRPDAFDLHQPLEQTSCVLFASPHSGRDYTRVFLEESGLDEVTIRSSEDAFVDLLFAAAPALGSPLLAARAPRAWVDLNRAPDELDPALIDGLARGPLNPRVLSGLGVIPRVVSNGRAIYRRRLSRAEAEARIAQVWGPYHAALRGLIETTHRQFGEAIVIDCHSMPHEAITTHSRARRPVPEVVLGDRFGAAAAPHLVERIEAAFAAAGFLVARNNPFAGAYVTQAYGRPSRRQHVVQIEIDRALYMDEARVRPHGGFDDLRHRLSGVMAEIVAYGVPGGLPLAAE